jgi:hypothetical protein
MAFFLRLVKRSEIVFGRLLGSFGEMPLSK